MSMRGDAYMGYLARWNEQHPNVVEPDLLRGDDAKALYRSRSENGTMVHSRSFMDCGATFTRNLGAYRLNDGRVVEFYGPQSIDIADKAFVWPNGDAYLNYATPMSYNAYHEDAFRQ